MLIFRAVQRTKRKKRKKRKKRLLRYDPIQAEILLTNKIMPVTTYISVYKNICHLQTIQIGTIKCILMMAACVSQEKEMEKQKILYQQARLHARGAAEMVLQMISASKGNDELIAFCGQSKRK